MKYYLAYETDNRPFLFFDLVADSLEELDDLGLTEAQLALVVTEDQLINPADPNYISYDYGICHKRIFGGEIVDRLAGEITAQQTALEKSTEIIKTKEVKKELELATFSFDGKEFPLGSGATEVYNAIFSTTPANRVIVSTTGNYTLTVANIDDFKEAYYAKVLGVQSSTIDFPI